MPPKSFWNSFKKTKVDAEKSVQVVPKNEQIEVAKSRPIIEEKKKIHYSHTTKRIESIKRKSSTSIFKLKDDILKKSQDKTSDVDLTDKPRDPFEIDQLKEKWQSYAELVNEKGRQGMYSTLTKYQPELKDNFNVYFEIDSEVQRLELQEESPEILDYLRKELNNYGIKLSFNVIKTDRAAKKHLNSKEIFLKMAENNKDLKQLRDQFNLDIEY